MVGTFEWKCGNLNLLLIVQFIQIQIPIRTCALWWTFALVNSNHFYTIENPPPGISMLYQFEGRTQTRPKKNIPVWFSNRYDFLNMHFSYESYIISVQIHFCYMH